MVGKIIASQNVQALIPGTHEYVALHCKKSFGDFIKDLEMWEYLGLFKWVHCNHKGPYNREAGESESGNAV